MKPATDIAEFSQALATSAVAPADRVAAPSRMRDFYELTKPRMNFLVVVTTMVGYYMAARGSADWARVVYTLIGTAKLNDVDPLAWLADALGQIADIPQTKLHELLPWNWKTTTAQLPVAA